MFSITLLKEIKAPVKSLWEVITDVEEYPQWNPYVVYCESDFTPGSAIKMKVKLLPWLTIKQKETIRDNESEEFLEYGISLPLGLLTSTRQHILTSLGNHNSRYESVFILKGVLAPLVELLLGRQLKRGFEEMTDALVLRAANLPHRPPTD